jgi:hypothetical protein
MNTLEILKSLLIPGIVAGGVAWAMLRYLSKAFLQHQLTKDIERYRAELDEKSAVLKNQLSIFAHEHTVAISRIDDQTAKAIHIVYKALQEWMDPATKLAAGCPIRDAGTDTVVAWYDSVAEDAHRAGQGLSKVFCDHAIYFDAGVYQLMANIGVSGPMSVAHFLSPISQSKAEGKSACDILSIIEVNQALFEAEMTRKVLPLMQKITVIFRVMLGVEQPLPDKNIAETIAVILGKATT